ncbi:unnamed protein product [Coregonus sp. 'balchen']|nr:unnamed protein product [Coregonus sp. 'balchen']
MDLKLVFSAHSLSSLAQVEEYLSQVEWTGMKTPECSQTVHHYSFTATWVTSTPPRTTWRERCCTLPTT